MSEIISLLSVFSPHLSTTTLRQLRQIVFAVLAMTGSVTLRNISRWTTKEGNITTEVYQIECRHKRFGDPLNVVCLRKTHANTQQTSHVLLFSSDLALAAETLIDYDSLRFQIEFNFRDAKQFWGLDDFINVKQMAIENAANLSMFRVNVSVSKLREKFGAEHPSLGTVFVEREPRVHTVHKLKHGDLTQEC